MRQGFPFFPILALILITLKLTGTIVASWWIVLAPIYIPALITLLLVTLVWKYY